MKDSEGPMIGWSLASGIKQKSLDDLMTFPAKYLFKAVGLGAILKPDALMETISQELERDVAQTKVSTRASSSGKYVSLTFEIQVDSSAEVYQINQILQTLPGIKYVL